MTDYSWPGNFAGCSCKINIGVYDYEVVLEVILGLLRVSVVNFNLLKDVRQFTQISRYSFDFGFMK